MISEVSKGADKHRGGISLTPRLQPGAQRFFPYSETVSNGLPSHPFKNR